MDPLFEQASDCAGISVTPGSIIFAVYPKDPGTTSYMPDPSLIMSSWCFMMLSLADGPLLVKRVNLIA